MDIQTIVNNSPKDMIIEYRPRYSVGKCSVGKAPFNGEIKITYKPRQDLLEFESFEAYIRDNYGTAEKTIEEFAQEIYSTLYELLDPDSLMVEVEAETIVHGYAKITIRSKK